MEQNTQQYRIKIVQAIRDSSFKYKTNKAQANSLGINPAQFSRIMNGDHENVLSEDKWAEIAAKLNVSVTSDNFEWKIAETTVYRHIYAQLTACQEDSISGILCDRSDIGKSAAAKSYVSRHRNAIYVDCSNNRSATQMLRAIAREFGLDHRESPRNIEKDLVQYIPTMTNPLIILDEFGDLEYGGFLKVKGLWNASEWRCGWYVMGADGLEKKMERHRSSRKVGYAEIFSRLGSRYQRITPINEEDYKRFVLSEIAKILKVNNSSLSPLQMYAKTGGSLRRCYIEIVKEKKRQMQLVESV